MDFSARACSEDYLAFPRPPVMWLIDTIRKLRSLLLRKLRPSALISLSRRRFSCFPVLERGESSSHHYFMNVLGFVRSQKNRRCKKFIFPAKGFCWEAGRALVKEWQRVFFQAFNKLLLGFLELRKCRSILFMYRLFVLYFNRSVFF